MKAEEFYKKQSKKGLTYDITCNPNPNYSQNFYQSIFRLMEAYAKQEVEENIEQTIIDFANFTNKDTDWALITTNDIRQYMNHILTQNK